MSRSIGHSRAIGNGALIAVAMLAALGCYTISLKVSSERATVDRMRAQVVADAYDIRMLQSELRTRARLPELQRWNDSVLALSAPSAQQFVHDEVQLASYAPGNVKPVVPATSPVAPAAVAPAPAQPAPLLPATPRATNQLALGMKTINYAVPTLGRTRLAAVPAAAGEPVTARPQMAVAPTKAAPGLDSSLLETVADAATSVPATDTGGRKAPMQ